MPDNRGRRTSPTTNHSERAPRSRASRPVAQPRPRGPWVNLVYLAGILSSLMVGTYSAFLLLAPIVVDRDLLLLAFACGFPLVLVCIAYIVYMLRVLFSRTRRTSDTDTRNTLLASAAMCAMWVGGAIVFVVVRGT